MDSNTILAAARTIDISLKETKGAEFVKRMQASLPRLPDAKGDTMVAEEKQGLSSASKEAVMKICTYSCSHLSETFPRAKAQHQMRNGLVKCASNMPTCSSLGPTSMSMRIRRTLLPSLNTYVPVSFMRATEDWTDWQSFVAKRSLAIAKELAILTTNLPVAFHSTIFLRSVQPASRCQERC